MINYLPSTYYTSQQKQINILNDIMDLYHDVQHIVNKNGSQAKLKISNIPSDLGSRSAFIQAIVTRILPLSLGNNNDSGFSVDLSMHQILCQYGKCEYNRILIIIRIFQQICRRDPEYRVKQWLLLNIGVLYAKIKQTYSAQIYIKYLMQSHAETQYLQKPQNYSQIQSLLKQQKLDWIRYIISLYESQPDSLQLQLSRYTKNNNIFESYFTNTLLIILATKLSLKNEDTDMKIYKIIESRLDICLPTISKTTNILDYHIKMPDNWINIIQDDLSLSQKQSYKYPQLIFNNDKQLTINSEDIKNQLDLKLRKPEISINQYDKNLYLRKCIENGFLWQAGYYFQQLLTNSETQVTIKQPNLQKVYQQFYGDQITLVIINSDFTFEQKSFLQKNFSEISIYFDKDIEHGIEFIEKDYKVTKIYVATHIQCDEEDWRTKQIMNKIKGIFIYSDAKNIKIYNDKTYIYQSKQQLFNNLLIEIRKQIRIAMPSINTPNFSFLTDDRLLKQRRNNLQWIIAPHCKEDSKKDFIEFLKFIKERIVLDQAQVTLDKIEKEMNTDAFKKQSWIINMYTQPSFFYRIINRGIRSLSHPLNLPYIRHPAAQMFRSILSLHIQQKNTGRFQEQFYCYRGCYLTKTEQQALKVGAYIQSEGFMSTSKNKNMAMGFGLHLLAIRVQVKTAKYYRTQGTFAETSQYSLFKFEEQVLFNLFNWFKVVDIRAIDEIRKQIQLQYVQISQIQQKTTKNLSQQKLLSYIHPQCYSASQADLLFTIGMFPQCLQYHLQKIYKVCISNHSHLLYKYQQNTFINNLSDDQQQKSYINIIQQILCQLEPQKMYKIKQIKKYEQIIMQYIYEQQRYGVKDVDSILFVFMYALQKEKNIQQILDFRGLLLNYIQNDKNLTKNQHKKISQKLQTHKKYKNILTKKSLQIYNLYDKCQYWKQIILDNFLQQNYQQVINQFKIHQSVLQIMKKLEKINQNDIYILYVLYVNARCQVEQNYAEAKRMYYKIREIQRENKMIKSLICEDEDQDEDKIMDGIEDKIEIRLVEVMMAMWKQKGEIGEFIKYVDQSWFQDKDWVNFYRGQAMYEMGQEYKSVQFFIHALTWKTKIISQYLYFMAMGNIMHIYQKYGQISDSLQYAQQIYQMVCNPFFECPYTAETIIITMDAAFTLLTFGHINSSITLYKQWFEMIKNNNELSIQIMEKISAQIKIFKQLTFLPILPNFIYNDNTCRLLNEATFSDYEWILGNKYLFGNLERKMGYYAMILAQFIGLYQQMQQQQTQKSPQIYQQKLKTILISNSNNHLNPTNLIPDNLFQFLKSQLNSDKINLTLITNQLYKYCLSQLLKILINFSLQIQTHNDTYSLYKIFNKLTKQDLENVGKEDGRYMHICDEEKYQQILKYIAESVEMETEVVYHRVYCMLHNLQYRRSYTKLMKQQEIINYLLNYKNCQAVWNHILAVIDDESSTIVCKLYGKYLKFVVELYPKVGMEDMVKQKERVEKDLMAVLEEENYKKKRDTMKKIKEIQSNKQQIQDKAKKQIVKAINPKLDINFNFNRLYTNCPNLMHNLIIPNLSLQPRLDMNNQIILKIKANKVLLLNKTQQKMVKSNVFQTKYTQCNHNNTI